MANITFNQLIVLEDLKLELHHGFSLLQNQIDSAV